MATQNRRGYGNPYTSADLGSGAKTTTGGSYRNPRLGIEDTTAFSRGVMSTLKTPEQEQSEEKQLEGSINYFGAQQDAILGGLEFKENSSLVKNFTNNQLAKMQIQYAKCSKANNQQCLQQINTDLGIYQKGQANIQNLIQNYADDEMYDAETSNGRFLIDVNGDKIKKADGGFATIADMTKVNNENPSDINIGIALNKNGDKKAIYQFKLDDGNTYTANISDYTDNYLKSNFDVRSNIHLNTQTAMNKDGATSGWVDEPVMFESSTNITTEKGTFEATTFLGYEKIVDDKQYFRNVDTAANTFSGELYKTTSSAGNNSAFNNLAKRLYNNKFTSTVEGYVRPSSENFDSFKRELAALPEDVKLAMLKDEGNEEWKIKNASKGHKRGDDGRAERLDKKYLIKEKYTQKPVDEDVSDSGGLWSFGSSLVDIRKNIFQQSLSISPTGKHQGKMVLLDDSTINTLQKEITGRFGQGTFIFKKDRLRDMLIKAELDENDIYKDKTLEDLTDTERISLNLRIKKKIDSYASDFPDADLFTNKNGVIKPEVMLQEGMLYNEDIKNFIKSFGNSTERIKMEDEWKGSDLQKEDIIIKKAVKTGDTSGLTDWQIKQVNFIIARQKIK